MHGQHAIDLVLERKNKICCGKYTLIFMDINMPVLDGVDATKILKMKMKMGEIAQTPIVAVTAAKCEDEELHSKFLKMGFDESGNYFKKL